ncbi:MAG: TetM/TetW/TetO/TetS family tetracycline resistance ribosomal protection protein [Oscillospiraceae bacterium]|nr:TetM/TetW/TetO/TetS family tetracycline resistance ribosomal protection protein [Oscillospiraceae bacterium]
MKRLVIGVLAHVDSGKTTLSEGMLYCCGAIRKLGRVDHKNAFLDNYELERERGITIFSKQAVINYGDTEITLLDTPGHVDFSTEMERTLQVLDYAVLVISGSDGVQSHTRTLWKLLAHYNIPVFIFVNKMDIAGSDRQVLMDELKSKLSEQCCFFDDDDKSEQFYEDIALGSEELMQEFLDKGVVPEDQIVSSIKKREIIPCCFGCALKLQGVEKFLELLDRYTIAQDDKSEFAAKIFKISEDDQGNRLTFMKITGGSLRARTMLSHQDKWTEKINHIRIYNGAKFSQTAEAFQGMVCAVTGLTQSYPGEGLGAEADSESSMLEPVLTYMAVINDDTDINTALKAFRRLEDEDPALHIIWNEQLREIHVQVMGEIQLEILRSVLKQRFSMDADFVHGGIAYKETIASPVEGVGHYEPLRHYAEVHLLLEPGEQGSGLQFFSDCREDDLDKNWQRLIMTHLREKTHLGVLTGSPATDIKITLKAGRAHLKHTEGGDFRQATYRAVRQGLRSAESILLEPWYNFILEIPSEYIGRAMADLTRMECEFTPHQINPDNTAVITGNAPVASIRDYQTEITGYTKGKGKLMCSLRGYARCHNEEEVIEKINYNCDSDTDNSCDSIFCSHGAGFVVKWDHVPEYMHIASVLKTQENEQPEPRTQKTQTAVNEYRRQSDQDKELMDIFEKTYGKVNQEKKKNAFRTKKDKELTDVSYRGKPLPEGPEYLLVDGYNIIFSWDELKKEAAVNLDLARSMLINIMSNYQGIKQCEVIVVFDAYKVKGASREIERFHNINVVYTKEAETADMYIEKVTHQLSHQHRVRVATSDGLEQIIILGNGAFRISSAELYDEVRLMQKTIDDFIKFNTK